MTCPARGEFMPTWKTLFDVTLLETRPAERGILITETERAIHFRLQEMAISEADTTAERLKIDDASSTLEILMGEIMAWENYEAH
jgi:hypothetical protein